MHRILPFLTLFLALPNVALTAQDLRVTSGQKIAFLGDSITQAGARAKAGYCKLVIRGLALCGVKTKMIPAGISGLNGSPVNST